MLILFDKDDKKIQGGSRAFFSMYEDFKPSDNDTIILVNHYINNLIVFHVRFKNNCYHIWKRLNADLYINYINNSKKPFLLAFILVPEVIKEFNITINDLKNININILENMPKKWIYINIIYNAYIENNDFYLTDELRLNAYNEYKKYRKRYSIV